MEKTRVEGPVGSRVLEGRVASPLWPDVCGWEDLEVLTKALYMPVGDEAGGEAEECFVDVVASFPADP